ncbi:MAG: restriction endonuclease subunit S [Proteobacteria bacterium]|nr:restriction endonuclease subunit S [Pseudomonadota bacterium]
MRNIGQERIGQIEVPLPPAAEQTRIVEKLEELLSGLDAGVAELKAAQQKLARYRQSLLKAAVQGELTAAWRGNTPTTGVLPSGWAWTTVGQLSEIRGGIQKKPSRAPVSNKFPFLRVANVARGRLVLNEVHHIELFDGELERFALKKGDVLVVEGNGSLTEIGRCAVWDGSIPNAVHQNHLIRVRPIGVQSDYLETWLNSPGGIERMTALAGTTSGLYTLSVGKIAKIPVPLPPLAEQQEIIRCLQTMLQAVCEQEAAIGKALAQSTAQRQNILRAAFSGQLLPQNPADEPASALLARIRAERAAQGTARKPRGRKVGEAA